MATDTTLPDTAPETDATPVAPTPVTARRSLGGFQLPEDWDALAFWGLVLAIQTYVVVSLLWEHAVNVPFFDDWDLIPALTGNQPWDLTWFWSQHNEHRIVLPRLAYLAAFYATGRDFRATMYVDAALLSFFAFAACWTARKLRGRASYADALFPIAILNLGHSENLFWGFQIGFVLGVVVSFAALLIFVKKGALSVRDGLGVGACAALLPLIGGNGLAFVPAFSFVGLFTAFCLWRAGSPRRDWLSVAGLSLFAVALLGFYFVGYTRPSYHPPSKSLEVTLRATGQFLTNGLGVAVQSVWPGIGYWLGLLGFASFGALIYAFVKQPQERSRALRLAVFLGGMLCLGLGIAWARGGIYGGGMFISRYVTLACPLVCGMYFCWELVRPAKIADLMQGLLFLTVTLLLLPNGQEGYRLLMSGEPAKLSFLADVRLGGRTPEDVAAKACPIVYPCRNEFIAWLKMLRDAEFEDFKKLKR